MCQYLLGSFLFFVTVFNSSFLPCCTKEKKNSNVDTVSIDGTFQISPENLIDYCCVNLTHCRHLRAHQKIHRGHCELWKPRGILINTGFKCRRSNLHYVLIQLRVLLVHLCMKSIVLQQPSFQCQGLKALG